MGEPHHSDPVHCICGEVAMGEHRPLWKPCCSPGVKDCGEAVVLLWRKIDERRRNKRLVRDATFGGGIAGAGPHQRVQ